MTESAGDVGVAETRARRRALGLLALALVLSMSTWFSASAVLPQATRRRRSRRASRQGPGRVWFLKCLPPVFRVGFRTSGYTRRGSSGWCGSKQAFARMIPIRSALHPDTGPWIKEVEHVGGDWYRPA
jgi:hypothetical protein